MVRHKYVKSLLSGIKSPWVLQISAMQRENSSSVSQNFSTPSPVVIPGHPFAAFAKMCPHIIIGTFECWLCWLPSAEIHHLAKGDFPTIYPLVI